MIIIVLVQILKNMNKIIFFFKSNYIPTYLPTYLLYILLFCFYLNQLCIWFIYNHGLNSKNKLLYICKPFQKSFREILKNDVCSDSWKKKNIVFLVVTFDLKVGNAFKWSAWNKKIKSAFNKHL